MRSLSAFLALCLISACDGSAADFDGDGTPDLEDCRPEDPEVYPGAPDPWGDGVDTDCDACPDGGGDGVDSDCDGYPSNVARTDANHDCDDNDASVTPTPTTRRATASTRTAARRTSSPARTRTATGTAPASTTATTPIRRSTSARPRS